MIGAWKKEISTDFERAKNVPRDGVASASFEGGRIEVAMVLLGRRDSYVEIENVTVAQTVIKASNGLRAPS
jgi:hypothetical protein